MPTFVIPSGTTRPFRPLREFNRNHEPAGTADRNNDGRGDGGQFARRQAGDEDRWGGLRDIVPGGGRVQVKSEGTTKSSSKGKGIASTAKVQVDTDEDHNPAIDAFVFDGRTSEDVASAMLKYADPDAFTVTVTTSGETVGGNEVYSEAAARESYDSYFRRLRPHEENRRSEVVSLAMQAWVRNVASHMLPGGSLSGEWVPPELLPADPTRASGKTAGELMLDTIGLSSKVQASTWSQDAWAEAQQAWRTTMQDIVDSGYDLNALHAAMSVQSDEWRNEALKHAAKRLGDPTIAMPLDEYLASRQVSFEDWVNAQYGGAQHEPIDHGKVTFNFEGSDGTAITRVFRRDEQGRLLVKHEVFESSGAPGLAKDLLRGSFEVYEQLGVRAVTTLANISTGAYSWARFGFLPAGSSEAVHLGNLIRHSRLPEVLQRLKAGLDTYWDDRIEAQIKSAVEKLERGEVEALWEVSDLRLSGTPAQLRPVARLFDNMSGPGDLYLRPDDGPRWNAALSKDAEAGVFNLGRVLLTGLGYSARFDMNAKSQPQHEKRIARQRQRLMEYIGDWTKR